MLLDSSKVQNKNDLAKYLSKIEGSNVVLIQLTAYYDPPFTSTSVASDVKVTDTVTTILIDYSVYLASTDHCVTGRIIQRSIHPDAKIPLEKAYSQAISHALPKLNEKLTGILKYPK